MCSQMSFFFTLISANPDILQSKINQQVSFAHMGKTRGNDTISCFTARGKILPFWVSGLSCSLLATPAPTNNASLGHRSANECSALATRQPCQNTATHALHVALLADVRQKVAEITAVKESLRAHPLGQQ